VIKGVFFDLGGTLYRYQPQQSALLDTVTRLRERLGLNHEADELIQHYSLANNDVTHEFAGKPFFLVRDWFAKLFANFLHRIEHAHLAHHHDWFREYQHNALLDTLTLKADCQSTLAQLKEMGLYLSIVSNIDDDMLQELVKRGEFHRWLDHWTSSEAAQSCKPDQRFFQIALEKSGLRPEEVVFVGDSTEQDILGAHTAGMGTVLIAESDAPAPGQVGNKDTPDPDYRIATLSELPDIIRNFRRRDKQ
jgi:HAD superfamily hydrolase (TIGR01509 family)